MKNTGLYEKLDENTNLLIFPAMRNENKEQRDKNYSDFFNKKKKKTDRKYTRPIDVAFRDIHKHLEEKFDNRFRFKVAEIQKIYTWGIVTRRFVDTKESQLLNKELKITGINKIGNKNQAQK